MNRSISSKLAVGLIAMAGALAALPAWAEPKIGVVDPQRLLEESPQGKAMLDSLRSEFAPRERTLQAQQQSLKSKQDKLQKDGATMSEDQRARAEKELRDGMRDFERARGELQDDATARRNEEILPSAAHHRRGGAHLRQGAELRSDPERRGSHLLHLHDRHHTGDPECAAGARWRGQAGRGPGAGDAAGSGQAAGALASRAPGLEGLRHVGVARGARSALRL